MFFLPNEVKKLLKYIRAVFSRTAFPAKWYWTATKSVNPISSKFGYDRGTPIDRYWIEAFLEKNKRYVKGLCLEVTDNYYTVKFGADKVTKSDVLDIDSKNTKATIIADIRNLTIIKDNTYDCIVLTHVLGLIDDVQKALSECHRILKPGGVILATSACISPSYDTTSNYWRFTPNGAKFLFKKNFKESAISIAAYGNALTGQCFWVGMSQEDLTKEQLDFNDPKYPCIVAIKAVKERKGN